MEINKYVVFLDYDYESHKIFSTSDDADDFFDEYWGEGLPKDLWIEKHCEMVIPYQEYKEDFLQKETI